MNDWPRKGCSITSEHKADAKHRIVGGASIVAKVVRDRIMKELQVGLGFEIGSGYPSDPNTIKALPELIEKPFILMYGGHGQLLNDFGRSIIPRLCRSAHLLERPCFRCKLKQRIHQLSASGCDMAYEPLTRNAPVDLAPCASECLRI